MSASNPPPIGEQSPEAEPLPPLHSRWARDLLGGSIPRERRATCASCAMRPAPGEAAASDDRGYYFDPVVKCCTFIPNLPNFLVGGVLADGDPQVRPGRASVVRRIKAKVGVTPLGLAPPPVAAVLYENAPADAFGRNKALKCPHYLEDGGLCGIWRHRESTCATWFCKHVRGAVAFRFWRETLGRLFTIVERDLARWCVLELGVSDDVLRALTETGVWASKPEEVTALSLDGKVEEAAYARLWGAWLGREQAFYRRCAQIIEPLSWAEILAICGPEAATYARLTRAAYARLTTETVADRLKVGAYQVIQRARGTSRISTYSEYDLLDVADATMAVLAHFDGRPTAAALVAIEAKQRERIEPDVLQKMCDFGLLTEGED